MKKIIGLTVCLVIIITLISCEGYRITGKEIEVNGILYAPAPGPGSAYTVTGISDAGRKQAVLYIQEEVEGIPVKYIGLNSPISDYYANMSSSKAEKIYMSWRTKDLTRGALRVNEDTYYFYINVEETPEFYDRTKCVVPSIAHTNIQDGLIRANIAYLFNYEDNPNEGYFFIDLLEESGTLTPLPYSPKREGYVFNGWYKDEACTEVWDFDTDTVTIEKDNEGNIIYEEIKLYAKWK